MTNDRDDYLKGYRQQYNAQNKRISITVSNAEYEALSHTARQEHKKVTALVKDYAFASLAGSLAMPRHLQEELQQLGLLIRNIANNVNQIARHSNRVQALVDGDEHNLLTHLQSLEKEVIAYTSGQYSKSSDTGE
jgi:hypothetical protein